MRTATVFRDRPAQSVLLAEAGSDKAALSRSWLLMDNAHH